MPQIRATSVPGGPYVSPVNGFASGLDNLVVRAATPQEASLQPGDAHAHGPAELIRPRRTPGPIARMRHETGPHGVLRHGGQLLLELPHREHVEVVIPCLPDRPRGFEGGWIRGEGTPQEALDGDGAPWLPRLHEVAERIGVR